MLRLVSKTALTSSDAPLESYEPRDTEILEGLKVAGIALGLALLAGLLSASGL